MGLTSTSTGAKVQSNELIINKKTQNDKVIAIAGNPNVGKSTLFNALTGMKQHTGNWPGKTVSNAQGYCKTKSNSYVLVDIPGTYSLMSNSPEEEIARNFVCFNEPDAVVVVCDATCLERNMNLCLQMLEITDNVLVCVNLMDEAERQGIKVDLEELSKRLGVPVVGTGARNKKSLQNLLKGIDQVIENKNRKVYTVKYPDIIENAITKIATNFERKGLSHKVGRWLSLKIIENDPLLIKEIEKEMRIDLSFLPELQEILKNEGIYEGLQKDIIASTYVLEAEKICEGVANTKNGGYSGFDRKLDRIFTSKKIGYPIMILLLLFVFWLTISGANYISEGISFLFSKAEAFLISFFESINCPLKLQIFFIEGVYRVPAIIVSVMLPPMAIFFPLFTLLEDSGYLPRVAYNLDKPFKCCGSCGKQALTMCMGFGCNAAGVVGCRIINSPKERLLAVLTNSLVPCNGRFPTIITLISLFFVGSVGLVGSAVSAVILTGVIILGIAMTFVVTKLLSVTVLKGSGSSYTLEMPPYRKPKVGSVIIRSIFDRTLFVLARSVTVAIPAGIVIWVLANVNIEGMSLLNHLAEILNPVAEFIGLDGAILLAFVLGFPANEIVLPVALMVYLSNGSISELPTIGQLGAVLYANGWTALTAICTIVFSLFHWPCSTTVLTIKKETASLKWTAVSVLLPTLLGITVCAVINWGWKLIEYIF